jgi:hypothetical protein
MPFGAIRATAKVVISTARKSRCVIAYKTHLRHHFPSPENQLVRPSLSTPVCCYCDQDIVRVNTKEQPNALVERLNQSLPKYSPKSSSESHSRKFQTPEANSPRESRAIRFAGLTLLNRSW